VQRDYSAGALDAVVSYGIPPRAEWWAEAAVDHRDSLVGALYVEQIRQATPERGGDRAYIAWDRDPASLVKIGASCDPRSRLRQLRELTGNAQLALVTVFPADEDMEGALHWLFREDRVGCEHGYEWFTPSPRLIGFIEHVGWTAAPRGDGDEGGVLLVG